MHIFVPFKQPVNRLLNIGIQVHRINKLLVSVLFSQIGYSMANTFETTTETLTSMTSNQNHWAIRTIREQSFEFRLQARIAFYFFLHPQQGIDNSVARNLDDFFADAFS